MLLTVDTFIGILDLCLGAFALGYGPMSSLSTN